MSTSFDHDDVEALLAQFNSTGPDDPESAASLCAEIEQWIRDAGPAHEDQAYVDRLQADLWFMQGILDQSSGELEAAAALLRQSIERSKRIGYEQRHILALRSISVCYENMALQVESTKSIFEAIDLAEEFDDDLTLALVYRALTALFQSQGAYGKMLESALHTCELADRCDDETVKIRAYSAVAVALARNGRPDESFDWINRASTIAALGKHRRLQSFLDVDYMFLLQQAGRIDEALAFAKLRADSVATLPSPLAATVNVTMAEVYLEAGDLDNAEEMLARAAAVAQDGPLTVHLIAYYAAASKLFEAKGDFKRALEMVEHQLEVDGELRGRQAQIRLVALERYFAAELAAKTEEVHHLRTVELVDKNRQLSDLVHQKEEMLHVVAHDLRSPLTAAQLLGESLMIDLEGSISRDEMERLEHIRDAATEMSRTIDTLLDFRDNEKISDHTSVSDAVQLAIAAADQPATDRGVTIEASVADVDLIVDAALLRRSVDDLLRNAIASAETAGTIGCRVRPTERGARITMTGSGVRFDEDTATGGSLYMARRLVERMNGSLTFSPFTDATPQTVTIDLRG